MTSYDTKLVTTKHARVLLLYPKFFGTTAWYLERALMRSPDAYCVSYDLQEYKPQTSNIRTYRQRLASLLKRNLRILKVETKPFFRRITKPAREILASSGPVVDIEPIVTAMRNIDLVIHVDGLYGAPILRNLDKVNCISALWALDTHLKLDYYLRISPNYDYIFVAQKRDLHHFRRINHKSYWLPHAADPTIYKPCRTRQMFDITFVGNILPGIHHERANLIRRLEKSANLKVFRDKWLDEAAKIYNQSRIVFNKSLSQDLNMRVFEALSCGRLLITDPANGLEDCFKNKEHLVIYDESSLEELIRYYLKNPEEREKISGNGLREVLQKHTYDIRLQEILHKCIT